MEIFQNEKVIAIVALLILFIVLTIYNNYKYHITSSKLKEQLEINETIFDESTLVNNKYIAANTLLQNSKKLENLRFYIENSEGEKELARCVTIRTKVGNRGNILGVTASVRRKIDDNYVNVPVKYDIAINS